MIDFKKITEIVPDEGVLILTFQKTKKGLQVFVAPKYKGHESNAALGPFRIEDDPEKMRDKFNRYVTEVAPLERQIASGPDEIEERKKQLTPKAAAKTPTKTPEAAIPATEKKEPEKKPAPKKSASLEGTFFEKKPKAAKTAAEAEPTEDETESPADETSGANPGTAPEESETQSCEDCTSGQCETCGKKDMQSWEGAE